MSDASRYSNIVLFDANHVGGLSEIPCLQDTLPHGFDVLSIPGGIAALCDEGHPWRAIAESSLHLLVDAHQLETLTVVADAEGCARADHAAAHLRQRFKVDVKTWTPSRRAQRAAESCVVLCADGRQFRLKDGIRPSMLPVLYLPSTAALVIPGGPHIVVRTQHGNLVYNWAKSHGSPRVPVHGLCHETCAMYEATGVPFGEQRAAFGHDNAGWLRVFIGGSRAGVVQFDEKNIVTGIDWHEQPA
jgi:hypothetical protein